MTINIVNETFSDDFIEKVISLGSSYYDSNHYLLDKDYLYWFYEKNPCGNASLISVYDQNNLIGFMALIPINLSYKNENIKAFYAANVLTHPEHRNKNLFVKMIRFSQEYLKSIKACLIGHPNKNAVPGWKRTKMNFIEDFEVYITRPNLDPRVRCEKVVHANQLNELDFSNFYNCDFLSEDIDFDFLKWRYLDCPGKKYTIYIIRKGNCIIGYKVLKKIKSCVSLLVHYESNYGEERSVVSSSLMPMLIMSSPRVDYISSVNQVLLRTKMKKKMPYFVTHYGLVESTYFNNNNVSLTLACSDF
ncbi:GNAT family N-acetyltransferase [Vibrio natriegens]|uniref:GNAT family N-acetyltransferase n=1 Tax=Vibrio natriegens TaxID=691 RepID=UPI0015931AF1|nr:GNAT family N-acetyltransferase [Vibrio natriegens]